MTPEEFYYILFTGYANRAMALWAQYRYSEEETMRLMCVGWRWDS